MRLQGSITFQTLLPLGIFAQAKLPEEVLPVPLALQAAHALANDTGQMQQDSV